jgi:RHS repeat-associated protein
MTDRASSSANITWFSFNYPSAISATDVTGSEEVQFFYGPDRQRWKQIYTGPSTLENTYYIGGLMDLVFLGGTTNYRHYIYAGSEPVAIYSRTAAGVNTMSYMIEDHQGGVSNIASNTGASDVNESFSAFGQRRNPTTWSGAPTTADLNTIAGLSRQGYTFQTRLGQSMGLNHMNGRVQDAILGRFLSPDPHVPDPSNAQSYNRYTYVNNNPTTFIDPTGFDDECASTACPTLPYNGSYPSTMTTIFVTGSRLDCDFCDPWAATLALANMPGGMGSPPSRAAGPPLDTVTVTSSREAPTTYFQTPETGYSYEPIAEIVVTAQRKDPTQGQKIPCTSVLFGGGASAVAGAGGEGSGGGYISAQDGSIRDVGGFLSEGAGAGFNVSSDVFLGLYKGSGTSMRGDSDNLNISLGPISLTLMFGPSAGPAFSGPLMGGTLGFGPGAPVGLSGTKSMTQTASAAALLGMQQSCGAT